ncbi:MAG: ORF6N domain-containing protein [Bacilli bacterium]|nr:ORF6N domain-containing protein [Bacilli bacterium]
MSKEIAIIEGNIEDKIFIIRGIQVLLDSDLAKYYGYTTKAFNQQVQRNIDKFDEEFMFKLTESEMNNILRSQNVTSSLNNYGGRRYLPYVFTEQGVYMVMTILKGKKAIEQSKNLIRAFKKMKDYLVNNNIIDQKYINNLVLKQQDILIDHDNRISKIENVNRNNIFFEGEIYDAYSMLLNIFGRISEELIIIDNYANKELLDIVSKYCNRVIIISKNLDESLIKKYESQYSNVTFLNNDSFHDRFLIIDRKDVYNIGSSIKDIGKKTTCINKIEDEKELNKILERITFML